MEDICQQVGRQRHKVAPSLTFKDTLLVMSSTLLVMSSTLHPSTAEVARNALSLGGMGLSHLSCWHPHSAATVQTQYSHLPCTLALARHTTQVINGSIALFNTPDR
jgi:hypothetical protein